MEGRMKYGRETINLVFPPQAEKLSISDPVFTLDKERFCRDFAEKLPEGNTFYYDIGIVVADKTRLCGYPEYLPWILDQLHLKVASKENIKIYIAYGTHPKQT